MNNLDPVYPYIKIWRRRKKKDMGGESDGIIENVEEQEVGDRGRGDEMEESCIPCPINRRAEGGGYGMYF